MCILVFINIGVDYTIVNIIKSSFICVTCVYLTKITTNTSSYIKHFIVIVSTFRTNELKVTILCLNKIDVAFRSQAGTIPVCQNGAGLDFSEEKAKQILLEKEIEILVELNSGTSSSTAWGCDLTYDYVKINGDYRT